MKSCQTNGNSASYSHANAVASAGHLTLIELKNHAYMHLYQQNMKLQRAVDTLQAEISALTTEKQAYRHVHLVLYRTCVLH